ncbi:MAG: serine/threonine-protein kinase [Sandaracinus sp.]
MSEPTARTALKIGDVLAKRYRLTGVLGEGGMGAVYEALQIDLGRPVAVKVLHGGAGNEADALVRFQREARVTAALHHPGAVKIFDFGRDELGRFFLVMEKLRGAPLRALVEPELPLLALGRTVDIVSQVASVLIAAHEIGLVHRDLKPENVFLERNQDGTDRVVVVDFGLAYIADRPDAARMTKEGMIVGTPAYMSPEQCAGRVVGPPTDIYALGCMLYEMVLGVTPFEGASFQLLVKHAYEDPPPPSRRRSDVYVPRVLEELILEMLAKAPEARPSAEAVVARLGKLSVTLGERERARGREMLEGRAARMIPTVRDPQPEPMVVDPMRATELPSSPSLPTVALIGAVDEDVVLGLRANGLSPRRVDASSLPEGTVAVFAPDATDDALRALVSLGVPVLTDVSAEDVDRPARMVGLGVADVVTRPVRAETLATKLQRAVKKHARRAR